MWYIVFLFIIGLNVLFNYYLNKTTGYPPFLFSLVWFIIVFFHFLRRGPRRGAALSALSSGSAERCGRRRRRLRRQGLKQGVKRKSTPQIDLLTETSGGEIEMDTFPSPLARRNRPSIEGKGKEGEREEKKKGEGKKVRSGGRHFFLFFSTSPHTHNTSARAKVSAIGVRQLARRTVYHLAPVTQIAEPHVPPLSRRHS